MARSFRRRLVVSLYPNLNIASKVKILSFPIKNMPNLLLFSFFLTLAFALNYCPQGGRLPDPIYSTETACNQLYLGGGSVCSDWYEFNPSTVTGAYPSIPRLCEPANNGPWAAPCKTSTVSCIPPCTVSGSWKSGGPNGKICTGLLTQSDCKNYYADNNGDRWCFWSTAVSKCFEGILCHD